MFYTKGWAYYRLGNYERSISDFTDIHKVNNKRLLLNADFMIGWCLYQKENYGEAAKQFIRLADGLNDINKVKAYYLAGKSYENSGDFSSAVKIFKRIIENYHESQYWDDSVFEYAMLLNEMGNTRGASKYYLLLFKTHPESSLVDEALYRRAEILYKAGLYSEAIKAFSFYRDNLGNGNMVDASIYWEGLAGYKLGDREKAKSDWKKLIITYKKSTFRADALLKLSKIHEEEKKYNKAMKYLDNLMNEYPDFSANKHVDLEREKVRYLAFGFSEQEAELTAEISRGGGASSDSGREAMLKLGEIYLSKGKAEKLELAFQYLNKVLEKGSGIQKARAYYLLGKYFEMKKDYYTAGKNYFNAAIRNKNDVDFFTQSLYMAAYNMKKAGYRKQAYALIKILENSYSDSQWTKKARALLEN